jgi:hypothetical protein
LSGFASDDTPKLPRGVFAIAVNAGKSQKLIGATLRNRSGNKMADIEMAREIWQHGKTHHPANFAGLQCFRSLLTTCWEIWEVPVFLRAEAGTQATLSPPEEPD